MLLYAIITIFFLFNNSIIKRVDCSFIRNMPIPMLIDGRKSLGIKYTGLNYKMDDAANDIKLPRHPSNEKVNELLEEAEYKIFELGNKTYVHEEELKEGSPIRLEKVFSTSYVDLGRVHTIGFDYDYTLVTYTNDLLELIYRTALDTLVDVYQYPKEMASNKKMKFDPRFSIRGLAIDRKNAWICHLTYAHKVGVAYEGRSKVSRLRLLEEYSGKNTLAQRLRPINDLFSLPISCLVSDVVQWLKDNDIPFCGESVATDIFASIDNAHSSGNFHRIVASKPEIFFEPQPYLREVIESLKKAGKRLIFVSNSPFWYVDAGMKYFLGENWRELWDTIIVSAGKPRFYTEQDRIFREVSTQTGRIKFKRINKFESNEVYTGGCLRQLVKCLQVSESSTQTLTELQKDEFLQNPQVLYLGDSLFSDLVDAKREFGWTTAVMCPEITTETKIQSSSEYTALSTIDLLIDLLRNIQTEFGTSDRADEDFLLIDRLERIMSKVRNEQTRLFGNPFGSIFRARHQPSLFAHHLRRYCDLYMNDIGCLRHYSSQHRFYPDEAKLLSQEN